MKSLDPRVRRLPDTEDTPFKKEPMDQLGTFEVFVQPKEGKPFQHEGSVHAPNLEMAFILAKENFTRRFLCTSLWVAGTESVFVSATTEGNENIYDLAGEGLTREAQESRKEIQEYEIFHLPKRGKQHVHFRTVAANGPDSAIQTGKKFIQPPAIFYNIWVIASKDIRKTTPEETDLWTTLPDKKFRDAAAYKGGDKLKEFLERNQTKKV